MLVVVILDQKPSIFFLIEHISHWTLLLKVKIRTKIVHVNATSPQSLLNQKQYILSETN